jgi:hypothetical protein
LILRRRRIAAFFLPKLFADGFLFSWETAISLKNLLADYKMSAPSSSYLSSFQALDPTPFSDVAWGRVPETVLRTLAFVINNYLAHPTCPVKTLNLSGMKGGRNLIMIASALRRNTSIKWVDMTDNGILCEDMLNLVDTFAENTVDVVELHLNEGTRTALEKFGMAYPFGQPGSTLDKDSEADIFIRDVRPAHARFIQRNNYIQSVLRNPSAKEIDIKFEGGTLHPHTLSQLLGRLMGLSSITIDSLAPPSLDDLDLANSITDPKLRDSYKACHFQLPDTLGPLGERGLQTLRLYNLARVEKDGRVSTWIERLPPSLVHMKYLTVLTISASGLRELDPNILAHLRQLEQLNLPVRNYYLT